jgi:hypothetical protein
MTWSDDGSLPVLFDADESEPESLLELSDLRALLFEQAANNMAHEDDDLAETIAQMHALRREQAVTLWIKHNRVALHRLALENEVCVVIEPLMAPVAEALVQHVPEDSRGVLRGIVGLRTTTLAVPSLLADDASLQLWDTLAARAVGVDDGLPAVLLQAIQNEMERGEPEALARGMGIADALNSLREDCPALVLLRLTRTSLRVLRWEPPATWANELSTKFAPSASLLTDAIAEDLHVRGFADALPNPTLCHEREAVTEVLRCMWKELEHNPAARVLPSVEEQMAALALPGEAPPGEHDHEAAVCGDDFSVS